MLLYWIIITDVIHEPSDAAVNKTRFNVLWFIRAATLDSSFHGVVWRKRSSAECEL